MARSLVGRISCGEEIGDVYNQNALVEREACWIAKVCWHAGYQVGMFLTRKEFSRSRDMSSLLQGRDDREERGRRRDR